MTINEDGRFDEDDKETILRFLVNTAGEGMGTELDPDQRSVMRSFYDPIAEYFARQQSEISDVLDASQLAHAEGEALTLLTEFIGVSRNDATSSQTTLRFSRENPPQAVYTIPSGTQAQTNETNALVFETDDTASIRLIDDFSSGNIANYSGNTASSEFSVQTTGGINDSEHLLGEINGGYIYHDETRVESGSHIHCRLELASNAVGGLILGHQDSNNHYKIYIDQGTSELRTVLVDGGTETDLNITTLNSFNAAEWHHIDIDWSIDNVFDITVRDSTDTEVGSVSVDDANDTFDGGDIGFYSETANCKYDNLSRAATSVTATASDVGGDTNVASGTVSVMPDAPSGVESVTNTTQATGGSDRESDPNLRARARTELSDGMRATQKAIINRLDKLDGTRSVSVLTNDTGSTDDEGRPGHSFEAVVEANDTYYDTIAQTIIDTKAAGDIPVGGYVGTKVTRDTSLPNGQVEQISFSEPASVTIYADAEVDTVDGYLGDNAVADAIVRYIGGVLSGGGDEDGQIEVGEDVIYNGLLDSIMDVRGVHDVTSLQIGKSDNPTGTSNITMSAYEVATTDASDDVTIEITSTSV